MAVAERKLGRALDVVEEAAAGEEEAAPDVEEFSQAALFAKREAVAAREGVAGQACRALLGMAA